MATVTVTCPDCCEAWRVTGISGASLNPTATCTTTPNLSFAAGCVNGSVEDAVAAAVTGNYTVVCVTPLIGKDGKPFPNPCVSKPLPFSSEGIVVTEDNCTATATIVVEDCPEFAEATAAADYEVTITLAKCGCVAE